MKKYIFFFLCFFLHCSLNAQTSDYTAGDNELTTHVNNERSTHTYVFDFGPDTLLGENDTLIIDIPRAFPDVVRYSMQAYTSDPGESTITTISLESRLNPNIPWEESTSLSLDTESPIDDQADSNSKLYYRLLCTYDGDEDPVIFRVTVVFWPD